MLEKLKQCAIAAQNNAYAPYSSFKVGAALLGADGKIYGGGNVENAAYPSGQCAEASAIGTMVTAGCNEIAHVVVVSPTAQLCFPCGNCRQKLVEFCQPTTPITMISSQGEIYHTTMEALLPYAYSNADLMQLP